MKRAKFRYSYIDWALVVPFMYLVVLGFVVLYSVRYKTVGFEIEFNLLTQVVALAGGALTVAIMSYFGPKKWRDHTKLFYWVTMIALGAVLFIAQATNGAERWISVAGLQFQPTEVAKLATILMLSLILDNKSTAINRSKTLIKAIVTTAIPVALIVLQPDLGSAVVFGAIWVAVILASRMKFSRVALVGLLAVASLLVSVPFLADYQQERLITYFNPTYDELGSSYNSIQAGIAIGSGGLTGNGLDSGTQSQLNFLPSQHTDFIFAVVTEKLGVLGGASIIAALALMVGRCLAIARNLKDRYLRGLTTGVAVMIFFHGFVNIGMNLGMLPVTGLPLPIVSYGGTFLYVVTVSVGMVLVAWYYQQASEASKRK